MLWKLYHPEGERRLTGEETLLLVKKMVLVKNSFAGPSFCNINLHRDRALNAVVGLKSAEIAQTCFSFRNGIIQSAKISFSYAG